MRGGSRRNELVAYARHAQRRDVAALAAGDRARARSGAADDARADPLPARHDRAVRQPHRTSTASRPTSYLAWIVPLSCMQGAGFAGGATGANLARDIEQGWFDRLLTSPAPRALLLAGPVLGAMTRALSRRRSCSAPGSCSAPACPAASPGCWRSTSAAVWLCMVMALWGSSLALRARHAAGRPADPERRLPRRLPVDRLHAAGAARRLARRRSPSTTPSPTCCRWRARRPSRDRAELGATPGPACSRCSA